MRKFRKSSKVIFTACNNWRWVQMISGYCLGFTFSLRWLILHWNVENLGGGSENSKTFGVVTCIIWQICWRIVNNVLLDWCFIVSSILVYMSSSNYSHQFVSNEEWTFSLEHFFLGELRTAVRNFLQSMQETCHQTWLKSLMTSPPPMLLSSLSCNLHRHLLASITST